MPAWESQTLDGGVTAAEGFAAAAVHCGIKPDPDRLDLALLWSARPCVAAGVFTRNRAAAAPVKYDQSRLQAPPRDGFRAIVVNSGIANAATGARGLRDAEQMAKAAATALGIAPGQVLVCSTGVIGRPLPLDRIEGGIAAASRALARENGALAARAIMTTDTRPKESAYRLTAAAGSFVVGGMAKGAGMIEPNMATMLAFLTTDLPVPAPLLAAWLRWAADQSFNRITIDHDTSTNDTVLMLAPQGDGARPGRAMAAAAREAILAVCRDLARKIVEDGEGVTRVVTVRVTGGRTQRQALAAARQIANSPLIKCSWHGADPNWGRIVAAVGNSGAEFRLDRLAVHYGDVTAVRDGVDAGAARAGLRAACARPAWTLTVDLGAGTARGEIVGCDLSSEYVKVNTGES